MTSVRLCDRNRQTMKQHLSAVTSQQEGSGFGSPGARAFPVWSLEDYVGLRSESVGSTVSPGLQAVDDGDGPGQAGQRLHRSDSLPVKRLHNRRCASKAGLIYHIFLLPNG